MFAVPPGGDGVYYFSTYLLGDPGDTAQFSIMHNNDLVCATSWLYTGGTARSTNSCNGVVKLVAGNVFFAIGRSRRGGEGRSQRDESNFFHFHVVLAEM